MNDKTIIDTPDQPSLIMTPMPMRSAEEQMRSCAGFVSFCYARLPEEGLVFVSSRHGGRCVMRAEEWERYETMVRESTVSMLVVSSEEEVELAALRLRPNSDFARAFNVMEALLLAHEKSLDEEDREEMLRRLAAQMESLKTEVLRAEEVWIEENPDAEARRLEDVEKLTHLNENEWLRGVVLRAGDYMARPLGELSGDECAAVARELTEAAEFIRSGQKGGAA